MSEDLKPCPFCGGRGRITKDADPDFTGYFIAVKCNDCGATSRQKYFSNGNDCPLTYQECRDEWNTRAAQSVGVKPLEWDKGIVDWARPLPGMKYVACSSEGRTWAWWLEGDG
jgi:Lar family restriction alleviation protein